MTSHNGLEETYVTQGRNLLWRGSICFWSLYQDITLECFLWRDLWVYYVSDLLLVSSFSHRWTFELNETQKQRHAQNCEGPEFPLWQPLGKLIAGGQRNVLKSSCLREIRKYNYTWTIQKQRTPRKAEEDRVFCSLARACLTALLNWQLHFSLCLSTRFEGQREASEKERKKEELKQVSHKKINWQKTLTSDKNLPAESIKTHIFEGLRHLQNNSCLKLHSGHSSWTRVHQQKDNGLDVRSANKKSSAAGPRHARTVNLVLVPLTQWPLNSDHRQQLH